MIYHSSFGKVLLLLWPDKLKYSSLICKTMIPNNRELTGMIGEIYVRPVQAAGNPKAFS